MIEALEQLATQLTGSVSAAAALANSDSWAPAKMTLEKLWHSAWPIVAGAALAAFLGQFQRRFPSSEALYHAPGDASPNISLAAKLLGHMRPPLRAAEQLLRHASFSGAALLVMILVFGWLLANR